MGETIAFLEGWQRAVKLGETALAKKDYQKAVAYFEDAYRQRPTYPIHRRLLTALEKVGGYKQALAAAAEHQADYDHDPEGFAQLFRLLLLDQQYLAAKTYLVRAQRQGWLTDDVVKVRQEELALLEKQQLFYDPDLPVIKKTVLSRLDGSLTAIPQKNWEDWVQGLTTDRFVRIAESVLEQAHNPFLRPRLVEELLKLGVAKRIKIRDLEGNVRECQLAEIELPEADPALLEMLRYLEAEHGHEDPTILPLIAGEIQGHFALSFPFSPQRVDPEGWAESYWLEYQAAIGAVDPAVLNPFAEIQKIKARYRELLAGLY